MGIYKYFFLNEKGFHVSGDKLRGNPRIVKFDPLIFLMKGLTVPRPSYSTLHELLTKDKRFKEFRKEHYTSSKLVGLEENVQTFHEMIFTSSHDNDDAGRMLMHLIEGNRKKETFTGIHFLTLPIPDFVKNFTVLAPANMQGVYTASFQLESKGKILSKNESSSMFPTDWTNQILYEECLFALNNKISVERQPLFFKSHTKSGIPVEMYFGVNAEGKTFIKTLYPIRVSD